MSSLTPIMTPYTQEYFDHFVPLLEADKLGKSAIMNHLIMVLVQKNVGIDLQDIETMLRNTKSRTYLIARKRRECDNARYYLSADKTNQTFYLFISTKDEAPKQVLAESLSYEINYKKLSKTGFPIVFPDEDMTLPTQGDLVNSLIGTFEPHN